MLHLVQSNKMAALADHLISTVQQTANQANNLFYGPQILVQSPGMSQWLKLAFAQKLGIAANLNFPLPSSFIWELYRGNIVDLPEQSSFTKPNLTWKLMEILPGYLDVEGFENIRQYLHDGNSLKRYQLCHKIADVYDQYLVYRPEWILSWESGEDKLDEVDVSLHPWQPVLWRALVKYTEELGESSHHRANLHQQLLSKLAESQSPLSSPLFVFGISALPQQQLEILSALAQKTDVYLFWCNPCQHYWGDIVDAKTLGRAQLAEKEGAEYLELGNPLLASWGKLGRDYQDMLLNLDLQQHDDFIEEPPGTLLEYIQAEVLNLQFRGAMGGLEPQELLSNGEQYPKLPLSENDRSVSLHACHSRVRELEVLQNYLLDLFDQDPALTPADIIVMMPDVAGYGPFIEGVFGAADDKMFIPFAISDRNSSEESPLIASFVQLMALHQSRFTLSEVLELLEVTAIRSKFDLSQSEFELVKFWLSDVGVRWGWDEQDKGRWSLPEEHQNTWLFGLRRLLAGYGVNSEGLFEGQDGYIAPYQDIEGQQAVALGKLGLFCDCLLDALAFCLEDQSLTDKVAGALALLDLMYLVEDEEQLYANQLRQAIEQVEHHGTQFTGQVTQDVFVAELQQNLSDKGVGQRFLAGSVNFCTLMPMRSIPFKVVCLLGMNDGDYPRQTMPVGFDLMRHAQPRKGDRSRRFDDRYLFLEALLSAQETLFISYQGYSQKDNSERSPSVLVSELVEYCEQCFKLKTDGGDDYQHSQSLVHAHLFHEHLLQPFSKAYFEQEKGPGRSFNTQWLKVAKVGVQGNLGEPFFDRELTPLEEPSHQNTNLVELEMVELVRFFENPIKALFRYRWQTTLDIRHGELSDEEPFTLDPLVRYQLNERLVNHPEEDLKLRIQAEGYLPVGARSELAFQTLKQQSDAILTGLEKVRNTTTASRQEVNLAFAGMHLLGWSESLFGGDLIKWRSGKIRSKDKLNLLIEWMCICAMGKAGEYAPGEAHFVGLEEVFSLPGYNQDVARDYLTGLLQCFKNGMLQPQYFFPETSFQWMKSADQKRTLQTFLGNAYQVGEGSEPHIARACPSLEDVMEPFIAISQQVWYPVFDGVTE